MFLTMMENHTAALAQIAPEIDRVIDALHARSAALSKPQALALAAAVMEMRPDLILDLGTGNGASSCTFAMTVGQTAARVCTFDLHEKMQGTIEPLLAGIDRTRWTQIEARVVDLETFDFREMVAAARSVLVFWDAHGHAVARGVLGNLMPLIADKPHLVICHDMIDNRIGDARAYEGLIPWQGMDAWYAAPADTARVNIGWTCTNVDQIIPITDFCWRNGIEFRSVDHDLHIAGDAARRAALAAQLGFPQYETYAMGYFTMNGVESRYFPRGSLST